MTKTFKQFCESLEEAMKFGKLKTVHNGYPIHHDPRQDKDRQYLVYEPDYFYIHSSHSSLKDAKAAAASKKPGKVEKKTQSQIDHDDWRDDMKSKIARGEVRKGVRGY